MSVSAPEDVEVPQVVNLSNVTAENVRAELVRASQSVIHKLEAEEADASNTVLGAVSAGYFSGRRVVLGAVQSPQAEVREAYVGGVRGGTVSLSGKAGVMVASSIQSPQVNALLAAGARVQAETIRAGVLLGRNVNGNVQTLLDTRGALLVGVAGGVVAGLVLLAGRLLFGRKK